MSLQINAPLTAKNGFSVPPGSYAWVLCDFGNGFEYNVEIRLIFFKDKAAFDAKRSRFEPVEIPVTRLRQTPTPQQIGAVTYLDIHNFIKAQLEALPAIGAGNVQLVL